MFLGSFEFGQLSLFSSPYYLSCYLPLPFGQLPTRERVSGFMSTDVSCMLPLRFSNSSNIASCLLLMASKAEHSTVVNNRKASKAIRINVVERNTCWLKPHPTLFTSSVCSLECKCFSPCAKFFSHLKSGPKSGPYS